LVAPWRAVAFYTGLVAAAKGRCSEAPAAASHSMSPSCAQPALPILYHTIPHTEGSIMTGPRNRKFPDLPRSLAEGDCRVALNAMPRELVSLPPLWKEVVRRGRPRTTSEGSSAAKSAALPTAWHSAGRISCADATYSQALGVVGKMADGHLQLSGKLHSCSGFHPTWWPGQSDESK